MRSGRVSRPNTTSVFKPLEQLPLQAKAIYDQLLSISTNRISVREQERRSIAREIHDDTVQALVALGMDVFLLKQKLNKATEIPPAAEILHEVQQLGFQIDSALERVRRIIGELRPETLGKLGLRGAIEWQAREFQARTGIIVEIHPDLERITINEPDSATALFRIFQEALTNVARHAMASRVEATIREDQEFFLMQIRDNGKGIKKNDLQKSASFGLLGLRERVFLLKGNVEIQGVPDRGTTLTVRVPLNICRSA